MCLPPLHGGSTLRRIWLALLMVVGIMCGWATTAVAYSIFSSVTTGSGVIVPDGSKTVTAGNNQHYSIAPSTGWHISVLLIDFQPVANDTAYTFVNVQANHNIEVEFAINTYTMTATAALSGGSVYPVGSLDFDYGTSQTYWFIPDANYSVTNVIVDGASVGTPRSYTFNNIDATHTVTATFGRIEAPTAPISVLSAMSLAYSAAWGGKYSFWPLLNLAGTSIDTAVVRNYAKFAMVEVPSSYSSDSAGAYGRLLWVNALKNIRAINPAIRIVGYANAGAVYIRSGTEAPTWSSPGVANDSTASVSLIYQMWRACRVGGGGWTTGSGSASAFSGAALTDSTGSRGFLWNKAPGGKGFFLSQYGMTGSTTGGAGSVWNNINYAYRSGGSWPVRDSITNVLSRQFIYAKDWDGNFIYDGLGLDLLFIPSPYSGSFTRDSVDWGRAGYASKALFDTAYCAAVTYMLDQLRRNATDAGRPEFIISANGGPVQTVPSLNGWRTEVWWSQQGGTWLSNFSTTGGYNSSKYPSSYITTGMAATQHRRNTGFSGGHYTGASINLHSLSPSTGWGDSATGAQVGSGLSGWPGGAAIKVDTLTTLRNKASYAAATAALTDGLLYYSSGEIPTRADRWQFDEQFVDTVSGNSKTSNAYAGWLGLPASGAWRNWVPTTSNATDMLGGVGSFEAGANQAAWSFAADVPLSNALSFVSDTALRAPTARISIRLSDPSASVPYGSQLLCSAVLLDTIGKSRQLTFWARASSPRPIRVLVFTRRSGTGTGQHDVSKWVGSPVWVDSVGFKPYRMSYTYNAADTAGWKMDAPAALKDTVRTQLRFWMGDTTGTMWLDSVRVEPTQRGGSYVRDFAHGVAIVNPNTWQDTLVAWRPLKRITSLHPTISTINTGVRYSPGTSIVVPPTSGVLLVAGGVGFGDLAPDTTGNGAANAAASSHSWFWHALHILLGGR
jgi:hypothetical protein